MISLSHLLSADSAPPSPEEDGVERLWADLATMSDEESVATPRGLLERVLNRIDTEPPRVETDAHGLVVAINPAFTMLCGYTFSEIQGRKPGGLLQGPETDPAAAAALRQAIQEAQACEVDILNYHKDGSAYRVRIELEPIQDEAGTLTGFRATETKLP